MGRRRGRDHNGLHLAHQIFRLGQRPGAVFMGQVVSASGVRVHDAHLVRGQAAHRARDEVRDRERLFRAQHSAAVELHDDRRLGLLVLIRE